MWDVFANQSDNFDSFATHSLLSLGRFEFSKFLGHLVSDQLELPRYRTSTLEITFLGNLDNSFTTKTLRTLLKELGVGPQVEHKILLKNHLGKPRSEDKILLIITIVTVQVGNIVLMIIYR